MLFRSERFQKDYKDLQRSISTITNEKLQKELNDLLGKLVREVKEIDSQHEKMLIDRNLPLTLEDSRSKLVEIRKQIDRKLRDWNQIKLTQNS